MVNSIRKVQSQDPPLLIIAFYEKRCWNLCQSQLKHRNQWESGKWPEDWTSAVVPAEKGCVPFPMLEQY